MSMPEQVVSGSSSVKGKAVLAAPNSYGYTLNSVFQGLVDNTTVGVEI